MKYEVYINDEYLCFKYKHRIIQITLNEISEFTISKVYGQVTIPIKVGKAFFLHTKQLPNERGIIILGSKEGFERTIQKNKYRKVISKYPYFIIKNVEDIFRIAEKLIDLNIPYNDVMYKEIVKYTLNNKKFYSKQYFLGFEGKLEIMQYENPDF